MDVYISAAHEAAVAEAIRIPALEARLAMLASADSSRATIEYFGGTQPTEGGSTAPTPIVTHDLTARAGVIDEALKQIVFDVPIETLIAGADVAGTTCTWARIKTPAGTWWADMPVTDEAGAGPIKLENTLLENGAFLRMTAAVVQG